MFEQGKVYISNLPNTTAHQQILEYLETAGPIRSSHFDESGQRLSATIIYCDVQSAQAAKKYLDQKEFNTRKIKITLDRNIGINRQQNWINSKILSLKPLEKNKLLQHLKALKDKQGQMFEDFLAAKPGIVEDLLKL